MVFRCNFLRLVLIVPLGFTFFLLQTRSECLFDVLRYLDYPNDPEIIINEPLFGFYLAYANNYLPSALVYVVFFSVFTSVLVKSIPVGSKNGFLVFFNSATVNYVFNVWRQGLGSAFFVLAFNTEKLTIRYVLYFAAVLSHFALSVQIIYVEVFRRFFSSRPIIYTFIVFIFVLTFSINAPDEIFGGYELAGKVDVYIRKLYLILLTAAYVRSKNDVDAVASFSFVSMAFLQENLFSRLSLLSILPMMVNFGCRNTLLDRCIYYFVLILNIYVVSQMEIFACFYDWMRL